LRQIIKEQSAEIIVVSCHVIVMQARLDGKCRREQKIEEVGWERRPSLNVHATSGTVYAILAPGQMTS
jgi:hypothetical protein